MRREVSVAEFAPRPLAAVRITTTIPQWKHQFGEVLGRVYKALGERRIPHQGINVMVYRHRADGRVDIECGVEVVDRFEDIGEVVFCETPTGTAATIAHIGTYEKLGESYQAMDEYRREQNLTFAGTCWEIYGHWTDDVSKVRTDLFQLIET